MPLLGSDLGEVGDITDVVSTRAGETPNDAFLTSPAESLTWEQLEGSVGRWAGALHSLGLRSGDRVASLMPNRPELLIHYLACLRSGVVAVPLNYRYTGA